MSDKQELVDEKHIGQAAEFDPDSPAIRVLKRKLDYRFIPIWSLLYLFNFLDRSNIGNARIAGLEQDLNLTGTEFNMTLTIFFFGYIFFEVPSNIMLKKVGPKLWITVIMVVWSAIMMATAAVKDYAGLLSARFFLGLAEAGLVPGIIFMVSTFYTKTELATRNGLWYSMATFSGAFGGILAYGISMMHGKGGLVGWQWIFIIEGGTTLLVCLIAWFGLADSPEKAMFLTPEERLLAAERLRIDAGPATETEFSWSQARLAFTDWQTYAYIVGYICGSIPVYAMSLFVPSIVLQFNYSVATTQIMTAPAFAAATITTIICAVSSDRFRERGLHCFVPSVVGCIGFILLIATKDSSVAARYVSLTVTCCGVFSAAPAMFAWFSGNIGGHSKRAVAIGLIASLGCIGGAIGAQVYRPSDAAGGYHRDNLSPEEYARACQGENLLDKHPDFRYQT
ncbi:MAG: major facilitator superfamily domain-containing protein [Podila humilis]|nr:MAG: major facilitator superfamily domain-containing protein [Podila humilis]